MATINGNVTLQGFNSFSHGCFVKGNLLSDTKHFISFGKYTTVGSNTVIEPPEIVRAGECSYTPVQIGNHVNIGENCSVKAVLIGNYVSIGNNCKIGKRAILKDCVELKDGTIVPDDTVIPPFSLVGGQPGLVISELSEGFVESF